MVATAVDIIVREFGDDRLAALNFYEAALREKKGGVKFVGLSGKYQVEYYEIV